MKIIVTYALLITLMLPSLAAQELPRYDKSKGHLPFLFSPYTSRDVPRTSLSNSPKLESLMREGKIRLSLSDAIALALENNLDLAIARYNLGIADTDVLRARAGASVRGVATGLVQGTPGGGVGGFGAGASGSGAGGTSGGAGGAGSGASGQIQSTLGAGAAVQSYDPVLVGNLTMNRATSPITNLVITGVNSLEENIGAAEFGYQQAFPTGTSLGVSFDNSRLTSNSKFATLTPELRSNLRVSLRQRLLSGFSIESNTRFLRIAKNNREISDIAFRNQVIATVTQIQNMYWDLVNAFEDAQVRRHSLELAQKVLSDTRKQVELEAMAPIEVARAESEVARREQELINAETDLQLQQLLMKNAITRNLSDPVLAEAPVIPTDTMVPVEQEQVIPIQDLVREALANRPELAQSRIDMQNREISRRAVRNALRPTLDLVGWYGRTGLAGQPNPLNPDYNPDVDGRWPNGYGGAFTTLRRPDFPDYAVGLSFTLPLRNRAAQADQVRSELEFRQAELRDQQLKNQIGIEVRNAQFTVIQARARVASARKARDLARNNLDIQQKMMNLGAATNVSVLEAQRDYSVSESNLVAAMSAYQRARVEMDRVTGNVLERQAIKISEAEAGQVSTPPAVPGVVPREAPAQ